MSVLQRAGGDGSGRLQRPIAAAAILMAALCGAAIALLPWYVAVGLVAVPLVLSAAVVRPDFGALFVLALVLEVIPDAWQPRLPIGGGSIKSYDLMVLAIGLGIFVKAAWDKTNVVDRLSAMKWPLIYLGAALVSSIIYVAVFRREPRLLSEARVHILWLLLPFLLLGLDTKKYHRVFVLGLVAIGVVISLYVVLQAFTNVRIMTAARIEMLDTSANSDITRSIAGGGVYVIAFSLLLTLNLLIARKLSPLVGTLAAIPLGLGLAVQYGRGVWVATAIGVAISAQLSRGFVGMLRAGVAAIGLLLLGIGGLQIAKPRVVAALIERAEGIGWEVERGGSFQWRMAETRDALAAIAAHPGTGVGLGGDYRRVSAEAFPLAKSYIHNSYLYFPLKLGLWAALIPAAFIVAFAGVLRTALRRYRRDSADRVYAATLGGAFAIPAITSVTQPEWANPQGIAALAVFLALVVLMLRDGTPLRSRAHRSEETTKSARSSGNRINWELEESHRRSKKSAG